MKKECPATGETLASGGSVGESLVPGFRVDVVVSDAAIAEEVVPGSSSAIVASSSRATTHSREMGSNSAKGGTLNLEPRESQKEQRPFRPG